MPAFADESNPQAAPASTPAAAAPAAASTKAAPAEPPGSAAQQKGSDTAPLPPGAEHLAHGRFDDVIVYKPAGTPVSFALFLSGDGGWNLAMSDMAQALVAKGAMVVGINTPRFLAMLERDDGDCEYTSGDLENLSHFVQAYYKLPTYLAPIMVGYSSGATFAYASLVQAPEDSFGGALLLGFCPGLDLRKPLCKGSGLEFSKRADGKGVDFLPAAKLSSPVTVLQGEIDEVCPAAATQAFVGKLGGNASLVELPQVGHGYGVASRWQPQFLAAYDKLVQSLKPTALPAPPASLNGLPIIEVAPKPGVAQPDAFAILISGDGGWAGLDQEVAGALSAHGIPVVGVDSLRYFWTARTPESAAADTDRIIRYYLAHWNKQQVLLVGYSQGADVLPFILNRLPAETRKHVALATFMGLSEHALFEFHLGNWVNANQDQGLPTRPEMMRPGETPLLCIYGEGEDDTLCPKLDPQKVHVVKLQGGHHFGGDYERLAQEILGTAKLPVQAVAAAPAGGAGAASNGQTATASANPDNANEEGPTMVTFHVMLTPLLSLIAGILILLVPRLLNYIVAIYLIAIGALGLLHFH
jgi:type IV secretory pathway VirJ component